MGQEFQISNEKANDLKHELRELKQQKIKIEDSNDDLLINIKRQLEHCKNIIAKKNEEIVGLKEKKQFAEKASKRRSNQLINEMRARIIKKISSNLMLCKCLKQKGQKCKRS